MATSASGPRISQLVSQLRQGGAYQGLIPNPGPASGPPPGAITRPMPLTQQLPYLNQQTPITRPMPLTRQLPFNAPSFPASSPMGGPMGSNVSMSSPNLDQLRQLRLPSPPGATPPGGGGGGSLMRGGLMRKFGLPLAYGALGSAAGQISNQQVRDPLQMAAGGGAVAGMTGNIPLSLAAAGAGANLQMGFQGARDGRRYAPDITQATGGPDWLQRAGQVASGVGASAASGNPAGVGQALAGLLNEGTDLQDVASSIPLIGGLFGGGGEEETEAQSTAPPRVYNEATLADVMSQVGLQPEYQGQLLQMYNMQVALAEANPVMQDPDDEKKTITLTPEEIRQAAWQESLALIPSLYQQQQGDQEYARRTALIQSEIAQYLPELQGGYNALADVTQQLPTTGMPAGMAAAAQNLANVQAAGYRTQGDALATALASIPSRLAMESTYGRQQQWNNQIAQAEMMQQLQASRPDLFASQQAASDPLADALLEEG